MMKILIALFLLIFTACENSPFECDQETAAFANSLVEGQDLNDLDEYGLAMFDAANVAVYDAEDYCLENYNFAQQNPENQEMCYLVRAVVDCETGKITNIYKN